MLGETRGGYRLIFPVPPQVLQVTYLGFPLGNTALC